MLHTDVSVFAGSAAAVCGAILISTSVCNIGSRCELGSARNGTSKQRMFERLPCSLVYKGQQAAHATLRCRCQRMNHLLMLVLLVNGVVVDVKDVAVLGGGLCLNFVEGRKLQLRMVKNICDSTRQCVKTKVSPRFRAEKLRATERTCLHTITAHHDESGRPCTEVAALCTAVMAVRPRAT